jgi:hypothetical protein
MYCRRPGITKGESNTKQLQQQNLDKLITQQSQIALTIWTVSRRGKYYSIGIHPDSRELPSNSNTAVHLHQIYRVVHPRSLAIGTRHSIKCQEMKKKRNTILSWHGFDMLACTTRAHRYTGFIKTLDFKEAYLQKTPASSPKSLVNKHFYPYEILNLLILRTEKPWRKPACLFHTSS